MQPYNTQQGGEAENRLCSGIYCICLDKKQFYKGEKEIDLTPKEFEIIKLFLHNVDKAISRDDILNQIWGRHYIGDLKIVDVNIRRIRQKIENDPSNPATLEKVWGYWFSLAGRR